jgi:hypothetical protein
MLPMVSGYGKVGVLLHGINIQHEWAQPTDSNEAA